MKRTKKDVWTTEEGHTLLERSASGQFYIANTFPSLETLKEMHEAIGDALRCERVRANMNEAVAEAALSC